eukprot:1033764-Rhodomonas_salina.1
MASSAFSSRSVSSSTVCRNCCTTAPSCFPAASLPAALAIGIAADGAGWFPGVVFRAVALLVLLERGAFPSRSLASDSSSWSVVCAGLCVALPVPRRTSKCSVALET